VLNHQEVKIVLYSIWYHHTCRCTGWERTGWKAGRLTQAAGQTRSSRSGSRVLGLDFNWNLLYHVYMHNSPHAYSIPTCDRLSGTLTTVTLGSVYTFWTRMAHTLTSQLTKVIRFGCVRKIAKGNISFVTSVRPNGSWYNWHPLDDVFSWNLTLEYFLNILLRKLNFH